MAKIKKKEEFSSLKIVGKILWFLIKIPYYIVKGFYNIINSSTRLIEKKKVERKREKMKPVYEEFNVVLENEGDFHEWIEKVFNADSKIGVILGARGSGKTAFGIKLLENFHAKHKKKCYAIGFHEDEMPSWIKVVSNVSEVGNDAFVLVDEGGVLFSSRESMSSANKILSELILIARHKNLSILFISQNSSNLEVNILRQADFLALKPSSLLQKEFERKIIQKMYDSASEDFIKFKSDPGLTYIYGDSFKGFISNKLPSFWGNKISKSFR